MKKRILSTLMALCLLLTLLPTVALADDGSAGSTHKHLVCGGDTCTGVGHTCAEEVTFDAWTETDSLPTTAGNYYLTGNVTLSSQWEVKSGRNIVLCLNGKTIAVDNASTADLILIEGTLTITDCKNNAGKITSKTPGTPGEKAIVVSSVSGSTLNLYGGTITKIDTGKYGYGSLMDAYNGGGVRNEGTFNMYGGAITENRARSGGGVDNKGTFTMYGGTISNNEAAGNAGGGVFNGESGSTFTMYGGTITGNTAEQTAGNDVHNWNDGTINANGGTIGGNVYNQYGTITTSTGCEGTVFTGTVTNGCDYNDGTISGGIYTGTVANKYYGDINAGTFTNSTLMNDGVISGGALPATVENNGLVVFADEAAYQANSTAFTGRGYVRVGEKSAGNYYSNSGIKMNGIYDELDLDDIAGGEVPGCTWDSDTNTLTLSNVYIWEMVLEEICDELGAAANITIVIDGEVTIPLICKYDEYMDPAYTGTITIQGKTGREKDTFISSYVDVGRGGLTIRDLTAELGVLYADGSDKPVALDSCDVTVAYYVELDYDDGATDDAYRTLALTNSSLTIDYQDDEVDTSCLWVDRITMDRKSTLTLKNARILNSGHAPAGLDGLKSFLPDGYSISDRIALYSMYYGYTILDEKGEIATSFTLAARPTASRQSYDVAVKKTENGTVTLDRESALQGGKVTITVKPDAGYRLGSLAVTDRNGDAVSVTAEGGGVYSAAVPFGGLTVAATFVPAFVDVPADKYFYDAVNWAVDNGITGGTDATHFSPYASCTRGQLVTLLWRAAGQPAVGGANAFTDVKSASSFYQAILWASENGIVGGYDDGSFHPNAPVTRQQVAAILYRYAKYAKMDVSVGEDTNILSFADAFEVSEYAIPALQWAVGEGVLTGNDGSLLPHAACTRAQIVTMLYRLLAE